MAKSILHMIESSMPTFSKGQKRIAEYILQNSDKAAFMTASKLGKRSGVSESTVVRFASELGYDGYPSMQRALQEMIRSRLTSTQRIQAADDQFGRRTGRSSTKWWICFWGLGICISWGSGAPPSWRGI